MHRRKINSTWNPQESWNPWLWKIFYGERLGFFVPIGSGTKKIGTREKEELSPTRKRFFLGDVAHFPSFEKADVISQQLPENGIVCLADSFPFSLSKYLLKKFFLLMRSQHKVQKFSYQGEKKKVRRLADVFFTFCVLFYSRSLFLLQSFLIFLLHWRSGKTSFPISLHLRQVCVSVTLRPWRYDLAGLLPSMPVGTLKLTFDF